MGMRGGDEGGWMDGWMGWDACVMIYDNRECGHLATRLRGGCKNAWKEGRQLTMSD